MTGGAPGTVRAALPLGARILVPIAVLTAWIVFIGWWTLGFTAATSYSHAQKRVGPVPYAAPPLQIRDHHGERTTLEGVRGRYALLSFMYVSCGTVCPANVMKFVRAHDALEAHIPGELTLWSVSFDVERDDDEAVRETWVGHGSPRGWTMGVIDVATWEESRAVVAAFGAAAQKDRQGHFAHPGLVFLVDPQGRVVEVFDSQIRAEDLIARVEAHL